jgi:hypothetical protein
MFQSAKVVAYGRDIRMIQLPRLFDQGQRFAVCGLRVLECSQVFQNDAQVIQERGKLHRVESCARSANASAARHSEAADT